MQSATLPEGLQIRNQHMKLDRAAQTVAVPDLTPADLDLHASAVLTHELGMTVKALKDGEQPVDANVIYVRYRPGQENGFEFVGYSSLRNLANAGVNFQGSSDYIGKTV